MSKPRVVVGVAKGEHPDIQVQVTVRGLPETAGANAERIVKAFAEDAFMHLWAIVPSLAESYEEVDCQAYVAHGPGHQSKTRCTTKRPHAVHYAEVNGEIATWIGDEGMSGFFNEMPYVAEGDDPR